MKNMLDRINSRLDIAEEKISEPEYIAIGTIQNEIHKKKTENKSKALPSCRGTTLIIT